MILTNFLKKKRVLQNVSKIDVGGGAFPDQGYFNLDTFNSDTVDFKIDFNNEALPFADNSIEHAVTYHALEHIEKFEHLLGEIWRVLKPNAQFFVSVPYQAGHVNLANIFHVRHFNEHSFRFFSSEATTEALPETEWKYHFTPTWGLKGSANGSNPVEFRTLKIEFDYFPEYRNLSPQEKFEARKQKFDVVHNICFYLQTIKDENPINIPEKDLIIPPRRQHQKSINW